MLRIGISSCFFPADNQRAIFKGKTLLYSAQPLSDWILSKGALAYQIPSLPQGSPIKMSDFVSDLDGLVLQGGSDVAPQSYGEVPLKPEWGGDFVRDQYEKELFNEFRTQKKPILGVCRGLQLINVALGGTLYQDITTQVEAARTHNRVHRNWDIYDHFRAGCMSGVASLNPAAANRTSLARAVALSDVFNAPSVMASIRPGAAMV